MERKKISYKRFFRDTLGLLKFNFWPLAIFELIYCFCGSAVIFPVAGFILKHALSATGLFYITGFNMTQLAHHPMLWVAAFILLLFLAFYVLIEFTTLTICFNESMHKRKVQTLPLMRAGFKQALRIIKPKNLMMILYLILIIPFVNLLVTSTFIKDISVPSFIMNYILDSLPLSVVFLTLITLLTILVIRLLFVFHLFALEGKSFITACRNSLKLLKGRFFRSLIRFTLWNLLIVSIGILLLLIGYVVLLLPTTFAIESVQNAPNHQMIITILLGIVSIFYILIATLLNAINAPLHFAFITKLYFVYSEADGIERTSLPLVKNTIPRFFKKKYLVIITSLILIISIGVKCTQIMLVYDSLGADNVFTGPQVSAHRGNSTEAPENTKAALEAAIAYGVDYVEIDIAQTKDGVLVVSHDNNLKRTSGENLDIWNSNYNDIKDLDIGSFFSPDFSDQRLMTLDQAIETCKGKVKMNIELKPTAHDTNFVERTVETIHRQNFENDCFLASLSYPTIEQVKKVDPSIRTVYISAVAYGNIEKLSADVFSIEATFVNQTLINSIHEAGKEIHVWTVDQEDKMDSMIKLNVDNIITDNIPAAQSRVKAHQEETSDFFKSRMEKIVFGV